MNEQSKLQIIARKIGAVLFGVVIANVITAAIGEGAGYIYPKEEEMWLFGFWGNHHVLRVIASIIGTAFGGFVTGCIVKSRGRVWGVASALPTSIFWVVVASLAFNYKGPLFLPLTIGQWIVVTIIVVTSPVVGCFFGKYGQDFRDENSEVFDGRKGTLLGIKWYHWFWLIFVIDWVAAFATYSAYQGIWIAFGLKRSAFWHNTVGGLVSFMIEVGVLFLLYSSYKVLHLLAVGYRENLTKGQIAARVFGWIISFWIVVGLSQFLSNVLMLKL